MFLLMLLLFFRCSNRNFYNLWPKIKSSIVLYFKCIAAFLSKKRNINNNGDSILDDATLIMVNLFIRSFAKIDDVKMEYSVQITFRQKWSDDRLTYQHRLVGDMESEYWDTETSETCETTSNISKTNKSYQC